MFKFTARNKRAVRRAGLTIALPAITNVVRSQGTSGRVCRSLYILIT
jgi:hypothetical protein